MLSRAELKRLRALTRARGRAGAGMFLAEGVRVVEDLLASSIVLRQVLIAPSLEDTARGETLARTLRERSGEARVMSITERELAGIAGTDTPQGVVAVAEIPRLSLGDVELRRRAPVVVLDAVQDPGNFGTIVRSADAFGAACIVVLPGTVDPWNAKAVRAAAGSSLRVPIIESTVEQLLPYLRERAFRVFGADMHGIAVDRLDVPDHAALILGNEGAGLGAAVRAECDALVAVPIRGAAESLNVAVAAGILLFSLTRES